MKVDASLLPPPAPPGLIRLEKARAFDRLLKFARVSIDDVVNSPVAREQVKFYFKADRQIRRAAAIRELEEQWNPLGRQSA